ncbi:hypothetical protein DFP93_102134 [Aneurinibacillus soli]|uniref:Cohesin domain-containing protein n=1 Tax=Aneurinibacillus soli TaxID=1500254 RepID=A0A0U5AZA5_9BACL|nr:cohesin domain-containing protein [Aneurinibacillus soli]PYE63450.1 hypothetical protein DFP93_102134 [Aneurinibacillus soli]BAU27618.1 hypothetical protein CB4_01792 [Aneurinibacillus soli]
MKRVKVLLFLTSLMLVMTAFVSSVSAATIGQQLLNPESGWKRFQDNDPNIKYGGSGWFRNDSIDMITPTSGDHTVRFNFSGDKIRILAYSWSNRAKHKISIDGGTPVEYANNLTGGSMVVDALAYEKTGLSKGVHTVEITRGSTGIMTISAIDIDQNSELSKYDPTVLQKDIAMDIQAPQTTVAGGTTFTTYAIVKNAKDLYAEDVKVKYDTNLFEFVKAEPASTGLHIYYEKQEAPGDLRFIVASNGEKYGVNGEAQLLKLTFKAKNTPGKGKIDIATGLVADSKGTEVEATVDGEEITVTGGFDADVNGDGKYSLGDVAIAGFHHSKDKAQWTNPKSDVDKNDKVEDGDLALIVQKILNP